MLRAADRYACILVVEAPLVAIFLSKGRVGTCRHKETPIGRVPISYDIASPYPAEVYGPANRNRNAAYSQQPRTLWHCSSELLALPPRFCLLFQRCWLWD